MKIFLSGTSFYTSYGGPAYSISGLARAIAKCNLEVGLWSPDGSAAESELVGTHSNISKLRGSAKEALRAFGTPTVIHDNGIWLPHNHTLATLAQETNIPRLVSVRGMLQPWAFKHKRLKKLCAWFAYQRRDLSSVQCIHATSESEAETLSSLKLRVPVRMIPNGIEEPNTESCNRSDVVLPVRSTGNRVALFLGRLAPVKGIDMLLSAWAEEKPTRWTLIIAGPDENGYKSKLEEIAKRLNIFSIINFIGPVNAENKNCLIGCADLVILPTRSENFGMVVAEALINGVPVLTTRAAPWKSLEEWRCGWWVDASLDGVRSGLREATAKSKAELGEMGERGKSLVHSTYSWDKLVHHYIDLYKDISS